MHLGYEEWDYNRETYFFFFLFIPPRVFILDNGIESYFAS